MRATNNPRMIGRSHNISRSARKPEYTLEEQIDRAARNVRAMKNNLEMALANPHLTEYNRGMAMAALAEAEVKHKLLRKQLPAETCEDCGQPTKDGVCAFCEAWITEEMFGLEAAA